MKNNSSLIPELAVTILYLASVSYLTMLAFGVLHSKLHGVPAFGYFETVLLIFVFRVLLLGLGKESK